MVLATVAIQCIPVSKSSMAYSGHAQRAQISQAKGTRVPRGSKDETIQDVRGSGKKLGSKEEAIRQAKKDANKRPHTCKYRGGCSSGDHVHVDSKNGAGKPFVRHYDW